jgi:hypothetical protein
MRSMRHRHSSLALPTLLLVGALAGLLAGACARPADPASAPGSDAADPADSIAALTDAIRRAPQDPQLRIALARAELAAGSAAAAEGSLRRALALGAPEDEVAVTLAYSLLAQQDYGQALEVIGNPPDRSAPLRLPLTWLKAETELRMTDTDSRSTLRQFVTGWRLRAELDEDSLPPAELHALDARIEALRSSAPLVEAARQHFACHAATPEPLDPPSTASLVGTAEARGRRLLQVGPSRDLRRPSDAARVAHDDDIVEIDEGPYPGDVAVWTQDGLRLRGVGGRAVLDSRGATAADQGIWVLRGNDITVENVEFAGARARARNGSGIRFTGRNLTVRNSVFRDNEAGLLTWNDPDSDILVEHSVFSRNGYGDGQSHNIYIGRVRSFTLRFSHSHDSRSGHEVKSRAAVNRILYNRLTDEEDGNSSYLVDLPVGGDGYVIGNELLKGARAENPNAISYASERPGIETGRLWVVNNSLHNRYLNAAFVRNRSQRPVVVMNNVLAGAPMSLKAGAVEIVGNHQAPEHGLVDSARLDFGLKPDSPLIDAGTDPGSVDGVSLWPEFEYVHPASGRPRQRVAAIDVGAREFCGW